MEEVWVLIFQILLIRMEFAAFSYVMKYSSENAYIIIVIIVVVIIAIIIIILIIILLLLIYLKLTVKSSKFIAIVIKRINVN